MNFLAHLYLSPNDPEIAVGNFIADSVKGKQFELFTPGIQKGVLLHRRIDQYTDQHEIFKRSKHRINKTYNHYSGVIIDIFYDHFLSKHWNDYSDIEIREFVQSHYMHLIKRFSILPKRSKYILPFMISQNWLVNYADLNSLDRVFHGMDRRTGNRSGMNTSVASLKQDYRSFENDFREFFPELCNFVCGLDHYKA